MLTFTHLSPGEQGPPCCSRCHSSHPASPALVTSFENLSCQHVWMSKPIFSATLFTTTTTYASSKASGTRKYPTSHNFAGFWLLSDSQHCPEFWAPTSTVAAEQAFNHRSNLTTVPQPPDPPVASVPVWSRERKDTYVQTTHPSSTTAKFTVRRALSGNPVLSPPSHPRPTPCCSLCCCLTPNRPLLRKPSNGDHAPCQELKGSAGNTSASVPPPLPRTRDPQLFPPMPREKNYQKKKVLDLTLSILNFNVPD